MRALLLVVPLAVVTGFAACSSSTGGDTSAGGGFATGSTQSSGAGAGSSTGSEKSGSSGTGAAHTSSGSGGFSAGDGGGNGGPTLIYAHDDTTLVQLDPASPDLAVTTIGDFDCIDPTGTKPGTQYSMTDIAVNQSGDLWGVTGHTVHSLTLTKGSKIVKCGPEISLSGSPATFYALTFAPVGVLDPGAEILVGGNTQGELWRIDTNGQLEQHGRFGTVPADDGNGNTYDAANVGQDWELSGDIVFLANKGKPVGFATVRDCPTPPSTTGCNRVNTLIEIDMKAITAAGMQSVTKAVRGQIVERSGCTDGLSSYGNIYGIAAWNDQVYGFSRSGYLVDIDISNGGACLVHTYPTLLFAGAGVTTQAPVIIPPR